MRWDAFVAAAPELGALAGERLRRDQLVLIGTIRRDGSPRISPNECDLAAGRLFISMMWRSRKALDILRDPRVAVHSLPSDRMNPDGDVKLYGSIVDEQDPEVRAGFRAAILERIGWAPDEPEFHCFSLDVEAAAFVRFTRETMEIRRWTSDAGESVERRPND